MLSKGYGKSGENSWMVVIGAVKADMSNLSKPVYGDFRSSRSGEKALRNALADGDVFDLPENATYTHSRKDGKAHSKTDYFDYYAKTVQIGGCMGILTGFITRSTWLIIKQKSRLLPKASDPRLFRTDYCL